MLGVGCWEIENTVLATIREAIIHDPVPLRTMLTSKKFLKMFGEKTVFGRDDELKTKPKMEGVTKDHPDIDLLKFVFLSIFSNVADSFLSLD